MDPRLRARRVAVQRDAGRRRLRTLSAGLAVVMTVGLLVAATRSPLLDVDIVHVEGASQTRPADLLAVTGLDRHRLLIDISPRAIAERAQRLPWVASADVEKEWPRSVRLTIVERQPVAVLDGGEGQWVLVDGDRRVLATTAERPPDLPVVVGIADLPEPGRLLGPGSAPVVAIAAALPESVRARVSQVAAGPDGQVHLNLAPTGRVLLGDGSRINDKVAALATVFERVDLRGLAVLDLRVPGAPVVTRRPGA